MYFYVQNILPTFVSYFQTHFTHLYVFYACPLNYCKLYYCVTDIHVLVDITLPQTSQLLTIDTPVLLTL